MYNKLFFTALFLFLSSQGLFSQVTMGSTVPPVSGALLDLKQKSTTGGEANSTLGVNLPRVSLIAIDQLEPCAETSTANNKAHAGLVVYNTTDNSETDNTLAPGIYYWDGAHWRAGMRVISRGYGPWYQVDDPTLPSYEVTTDSYLNAKAVVGGTDVINDATLSVHGGLSVTDTPIISNATALVVDTDGKIGTAASIPAKVAFIQSSASTYLTASDINSMNSQNRYTVPWLSSDVITNNNVLTYNSDNTFTINTSGIYEVSGYSNFSLNLTDTENSSKYTFLVLVSLQYLKSGETTWVDISSARYQSWPSAASGQNVQSLTYYYPYPATIYTFNTGDKIRITITNPSPIASYKWIIGAGLPFISPATGGKYSRGFKVQAL